MVNRVLHFQSLSLFPEVGRQGVIYINEEAGYNKSYIWDTVDKSYKSLYGDVMFAEYAFESLPFTNVKQALDYIFSEQLGVTFFVTPESVTSYGINELTFFWSVANPFNRTLTASIDNGVGNVTTSMINDSGSITELVNILGDTTFTITISDGVTSVVGSYTVEVTLPNIKVNSFTVTPSLFYEGSDEVGLLFEWNLNRLREDVIEAKIIYNDGSNHTINVLGELFNDGYGSSGTYDLLSLPTRGITYTLLVVTASGSANDSVAVTYVPYDPIEVKSFIVSPSASTGVEGIKTYAFSAGINKNVDNIVTATLSRIVGGTVVETIDLTQVSGAIVPGTKFINTGNNLSFDITETTNFVLFIEETDEYLNMSTDSDVVYVNMVDNVVGDLSFIVRSSETLLPIEGAVINVPAIGNETTNVNGTVKFTGVTFPSIYTYTISCDGFAPASGSVNPTETSIYTVDVDPVSIIEYNNVEFVITDGVLPINGASVALVGTNYIGVTGVDGVVNFEDVEDGEYTYTVYADGFVGVVDSPLTISGDVVVEVELTLVSTDVSTLQFTVTDDLTAIALESVSVSVVQSGLTVASGTTDINGALEVTVPYGSGYTYTISKQHFVTNTSSVFTIDTALFVIDVALGADVTISNESIASSTPPLLDVGDNAVFTFSALPVGYEGNHQILWYVDDDIVSVSRKDDGTGWNELLILPEYSGGLLKVEVDFYNVYGFIVSASTLTMQIQNESTPDPEILFGYRTSLQGELLTTDPNFEDIVTGIMDESQQDEITDATPDTINVNEFDLGLTPADYVWCYFLVPATVDDYNYADWQNNMGAPVAISAVIKSGDPVSVSIGGESYKLYRRMQDVPQNFTYSVTSIS